MMVRVTVAPVTRFDVVPTPVVPARPLGVTELAPMRRKEPAPKAETQRIHRAVFKVHEGRGEGDWRRSHPPDRLRPRQEKGEQGVARATQSHGISWAAVGA